MQARQMLSAGVSFEFEDLIYVNYPVSVNNLSTFSVCRLKLHFPAPVKKMAFSSSSPLSVQLCGDSDGFEDSDRPVFDLKCFKDSQKICSLGITPSQVDPLGEFSQAPEDHYFYEEEDDGSDSLIEGAIFNTQMTELKEDDCGSDLFEDDQNSKKYNTIFFDDSVPHTGSTAAPPYGTDGYVRQKITEISGTTDPSRALQLIKDAKNIVLVCGAGISVSAGIPDFRSEGRGLYALLDSFLSEEKQLSPQAEAFFGGLKGWQLDALQRLDEPESLFDLEFFVNDPHPFYVFLLATRFGSPISARFAPTACHRTIASLPNLLLSFTQNIDTLEAAAGLAQVCYCHGSFESVSCIKCKRSHDLEFFWKLLELYAGESLLTDSISYLPVCQYCTNNSDSEDDEDNIVPLLKPDIVFFGESLPANFFAHIRSTLPACDLLVVTGSSMKVLPVASIPDLIPSTIPQILINKDPILDHNFDLELLGEADVIWSWIAQELKLKNHHVIVPDDDFNIEFISEGRFLFK